MNKKLIGVGLLAIALVIWLFQSSGSAFNADQGFFSQSEKIVCDMTIDKDSIINPRCVNTHNSCFGFNTMPFNILSTEVNVFMTDGDRTESEPFKVSKLGINQNIQLSLCSKMMPAKVNLKLLRDGVIQDQTDSEVG